MRIFVEKSNFNNPEDRYGLPGWTYFSPSLFQLEAEKLFRQHWQLVCHESDVANKGQFITFDLVNERALIIKGKDGIIRAFHNLCRHRGSRVVAEERGICKSAMVCPFHGWSFNLDGSLRGISQSQSFPNLDPREWGLKPIECEIWQGFIFIRFKPGDQPSISKIMAPYEKLVKDHQLEKLVSCQPPSLSDCWTVNWKAMRDVDNEAYHVPMAHPGLQDLYGKDYKDYEIIGDTTLNIGTFNSTPSSRWSVKLYRKMIDNLPKPLSSLPKAWVYISIFPNQVISLYPDSVIFYQDIPISVNTSRQRYAVYARPNEDRVTRVARKLSGRIDAITAIEDMQLMQWSYEAMQSSAFDGLMLSDLESGVGQYHSWLKKRLPVMSQSTEPLEIR
jgi:phenylpropionate dioxygenase-like ring-hydroxylating dioxygenase large terminal subunit